jgi:hypothetical protein
MKLLPKEFQFKCDEYSLEQCKKLGIMTHSWEVSKTEYYYAVKENSIVDYFHNSFDDCELISLADYIESETTHEKSLRLLKEYISETPKEEVKKIIDYYNNLYYEEPDHSDLIVELTGKYVAAMFSKPTKLPTDELPISVAIIYAEETVKQLKEKKYL